MSIRLIWLGLSFFFLFFCVLFYFRGSRPSLSPVPMHTPAPVAPAPSPASAPPPQQAVEKPRSYDVISATEDGGTFQLDARVLKQTLPLMVTDGDRVHFKASGTVCAYGVPCNTPNGQTGPAKRALIRPDSFPVGEALMQEFVAY